MMMMYLNQNFRSSVWELVTVLLMKRKGRMCKEEEDRLIREFKVSLTESKVREKISFDEGSVMNKKTGGYKRGKGEG